MTNCHLYDFLDGGRAFSKVDNGKVKKWLLIWGPFFSELSNLEDIFMLEDYKVFSSLVKCSTLFVLFDFLLMFFCFRAIG